MQNRLLLLHYIRELDEMEENGNTPPIGETDVHNISDFIKGGGSSSGGGAW